MMVLPVMARATRHLGLGATLSTTFFNHYHLARTLAAPTKWSKPAARCRIAGRTTRW
jgi:hypothetical protein